MRVLMIFLDGVGLGGGGEASNPFAAAYAPILHNLSGGNRWLKSTGRVSGERSEFVPTDPCLGVGGRPQSGTGQATIVTGLNVPQLIGRHYGPKPDAMTRTLLDQQNVFKTVVERGKTAALIEAYPKQWHDQVNSGKRLPASYQYAAKAAGLRFMDESDVVAGRGITGDWMRDVWRRDLNMPELELLTAYEAGQMLVDASRAYDFAFMAHWMTDIVGHRGSVEKGIELIERFDGVMSGVLDAWDDEDGLIVITSDHGNLEDMSHRRHTENDVPTVVIGNHRKTVAHRIHSLVDLTPAILDVLFSPNNLESAEMKTSE